MPELVRMYIRHVAIGFAISALFVGLLMWGNVMNLRHLVLHANGGWLSGFLLWFFNGLVFAGAQFGIAVMNMGEPSDPDGGRRSPELSGALSPEPVPLRLREDPR
jgi:hypothetical protein